MNTQKELRNILAELLHTNPIPMGDLIITRDRDSIDNEGMGITLFDRSDPSEHTFLNELGFQELKKISILVESISD